MGGLRGGGTLRSLTLAFLADTKGVLRGVQEVKTATTGLNQDLSKTGTQMGGIKSTALGFGVAALGLAGISTTFGGIQSAVIGMNSTLETSSLQFETLMGDSDRAKEHVQMLFDFAKYTPFETGPIIQASRMLQTFGGDALNTKDNLYLFGDAAAAVSTDFSSLSFWVGRMYSAIQGGQPFGEAAMRLQELAVLSPQVRQEMEALQKSGASASDIWGVFATDLERFDGAMEKQAGTWQGLTSTLSDAFNLLMAEAFRPFFEMGKEGMRDMIDLFSDPAFKAGLMSVADALLTVGGQAANLVKVAADLALMWAEHVDTLLPLAVAWLGIKYVRSLKDATTGTYTLTGALKGMRGMLLLGLPLILEGIDYLQDWVAQVRFGTEAANDMKTAGDALNTSNGFLGLGIIGSHADQIDDLTTSLYEAEHGAMGFFESYGDGWWQTRDEVTDILNDLGDRFGPVFDELQQKASEWGKDWKTVAEDAIRMNEELGYSWEDYVSMLEDTSLTGTGMAGRFAEAGAAAADALVDPITGATGEAVEEVRNMYTDIATVMKEAEDKLRKAGGDAVQAWLDPQVWRTQAVTLGAELETAWAEYEEISRSGTEAEIAEAQRRTLELTGEMMNLQVNLATVGTEMEQTAALNALRTSDMMLEGLSSNDPEIKALFLAWHTELTNQMLAMQEAALFGGKTISQLLAQGISEDAWRAQSAAAGLAQVIKDEMPGSEPKSASSPLRGITKAWGLVGMIADAMDSDLPRMSAAAQRLAGAMRPEADMRLARPSWAAAESVSARNGVPEVVQRSDRGDEESEARGAARIERHAHIHVRGIEPELRVAKDAVRLWDRLDFIDNG